MVAALKKIDWWLMAGVGYLALVSLLVIRGLPGTDAVSYFWRQLTWCSIGLICVMIFVIADWRKIFESQLVIVVFYLCSLFLLLGVLLVGNRIRGASSWFELGSFNFQPSEFAKLALMFFLARYFSRRHSDIWSVRYLVVPALYTTGLAIPTFLQPALGSALVILFMFFSLIVLLGLRVRHILFGLFIAFFFAGIAWVMLLKPYQKERILNFVNPGRDPLGSGYHALQAKIAVGSGGFWGRGLGQGTETQLQLLPETRTDFIFSAYAEEFGLAGVLLLLAAFGVMFGRLTFIAARTRSNFSTIFVLLFLLKIYIEVTINIGGNIGLLPITGIALPFVSYGGSSLLVNYIGLGIVQGIYVRSRSV
ncbi:MAG: rod shape-determining protein RodA [Patescibacteria group bacterium]|nr:rod shape-determining protein RodA [Patescibacteria group bacterium]MDE2438026.1 rod shape-determining protein RodA [Patescibacteria group bacterium]